MLFFVKDLLTKDCPIERQNYYSIEVISNIFRHDLMDQGNTMHRKQNYTD